MKYNNSKNTKINGKMNLYKEFVAETEEIHPSKFQWMMHCLQNKLINLYINNHLT